MRLTPMAPHGGQPAVPGAAGEGERRAELLPMPGGEPLGRLAGTADGLVIRLGNFSSIWPPNVRLGQIGENAEWSPPNPKRTVAASAHHPCHRRRLADDGLTDFETAVRHSLPYCRGAQRQVHGPGTIQPAA
jgi:hypothetical protein